MTYLLDTNVISELRKRHPDPNVVAWFDTVSSAEIFISALTIGEIRLGIERLRGKDSAQAEHLEHWLQGLRATYQDHIAGLFIQCCIGHIDIHLQGGCRVLDQCDVISF